MKKRWLSNIFPVIFTIVILASFVVPGRAAGWSAVVGNRTHSDIDDAAYKILSNDPAFPTVKFPTPDSIKNNDWVEPIARTGTGPDVLGSSNAGEHFYNPRLEAVQTKAGGGPDSVKQQFTNLVNAYSSGNAADAGKAASWAAHYISDLNMPYHTQGTYRSDIMKIYTAAGGASATTVPLPAYITGPMGLSTSFGDHPNDFKKEIQAFLTGTANHTTTEDWFDPWYWDGRVKAMELSSHVTYEAGTFAMPGTVTSFIFGGDTSGGVKGYSPIWSNLTPSFDNVAAKQAANIREFARKNALVAKGTTDGVQGQVSSATPYLESAIEGAATVWRASFSALVPTINIGIPDKTKPQKLKVTGWVTNWAGETANAVQVKLTVTGGTLKGGNSSPVIGELYPTKQQSLTWDVEASNLGYCTIQMEVIGSYKDTPDMQYAVTKVSMPGVIPVTSQTTPTSRAHSIVFCLDNSYSMKGQPIIDAMNAGVQAVNTAPSGLIEMSLFFFGTNECDPPVRIIDFTVDRDRIKAAIQTASARGNTPLAAAITAAGQYIKSSAKGQEATIILLTDGMETCSGDPAAAARALNPNLKLKTGLFTKPLYAASDTVIKLQVVGFNIGVGTNGEATLKQVAAAGNGKYYPANNVQELTRALSLAVKEGTGSGIQLQTWWFIAGGAALLFFIIIATRSGKRKTAPAAGPAGVSNAAPPPVFQQPVVRSTPPSSPAYSPFCPGCGFRVQPGAAFCSGCGRALALAAAPGAVPQAPPQGYCARCGGLNTPGSAFCSKCGNQLAVNMAYAAAQAISQPLQTYCPQCGVPNAAGSAFCNRCGSAFQPVHAAPLPQPGQARGSPVQAAAAPKAAHKVSGIWWLIAIIFLLPGGLIAWAAVKKHNPNSARGLLMVSMMVTALVFFTIVTNLIN